jgi:uncharacterized protein DUF397
VVNENTAVSGPPAGIDLAEAVWRKSTHSPSRDGDCVEVAFMGNAILVRDSTRPDGHVLVFTPREWDAFVDGAKDGEFDL